MLNKQIEKFTSLEAFSGILLLAMLALALICANSSLHSLYEAFQDIPFQIGLGQILIKKPLLLWVNEGLMAIFFMLLALEMKREILAGELSRASQLLLPCVAAVGGILGPTLIYVLLNHGHALKMLGWPISTTTDIAFALSVIALLGKKVPPSLKAILVALSIVDDLLAIIIIAAFYSGDLSWVSLAFSFVCIGILAILNRAGVNRVAPYMIVGFIIWVLVLKSGVHATLAGVAVGLAIPYNKEKTIQESPLCKLENALHPWSAFLILPLFVFINGGIYFGDFRWSSLFHSVPLGITLGLFLGKSLGSFSLVWLLLKFKWITLPSGSTTKQLFALLCLTGIGFTMSLFIAALAFNGTEFEELARQGVLFGSILSAALGVLIFSINSPAKMLKGKSSGK